MLSIKVALVMVRGFPHLYVVIDSLLVFWLTPKIDFVYYIEDKYNDRMNFKFVNLCP